METQSKYKSDTSLDISVVDTMTKHQFDELCYDLLKYNGFTDTVILEQTSITQNKQQIILTMLNDVSYGILFLKHSNDGVQIIEDLAGFILKMAENFKRISNSENANIVILTNGFFPEKFVTQAKHNNILLWDRNELEHLLKSMPYEEYKIKQENKQSPIPYEEYKIKQSSFPYQTFDMDGIEKIKNYSLRLGIAALFGSIFLSILLAPTGDFIDDILGGFLLKICKVILYPYAVISFFVAIAELIKKAKYKKILKNFLAKNYFAVYSVSSIISAILSATAFIFLILH